MISPTPSTLFRPFKLSKAWINALHPVYTQTRRAQSSEATSGPPPPGGHLPSVATSQFLKNTRESSLHTQGIRWIDELPLGPQDVLSSGRETRKMNMFQAIRDAMRCLHMFLAVCMKTQRWITVSLCLKMILL